jgi:hypothetical protein
MNYALLEQFIKMIIETDVNPAAANQLLPPSAPKVPQGEKKGDKRDRKNQNDSDHQDESELAEFSGVGAIAGFTAPLGLGASDMGVKSKRGPKKKWY